MRHLVLVVMTVVVVVAATCSIAVPVNGAVANSTSPVGVEPAAAGAAAAEAPPELVNDDQPSDDGIDASALPDGVAPGSKDSSNTTTGVDWEQAEASLTAYTRNLTSDMSSGSSGSSNSSISSTASGDEEGTQQPLLAPSEVKQWDGALSNLGVDDDGEDDDAEGGGGSGASDAAGADSGSSSSSSSNTEEAESEPADADGSDSDSSARGQDLTPTEPQATNTTDKEGSQPGDDDDVATESRLAKLQAHLKEVVEDAAKGLRAVNTSTLLSPRVGDDDVADDDDAGLRMQPLEPEVEASSEGSDNNSTTALEAASASSTGTTAADTLDNNNNNNTPQQAAADGTSEEASSSGSDSGAGSDATADTITAKAPPVSQPPPSLPPTAANTTAPAATTAAQQPHTVTIGNTGESCQEACRRQLDMDCSAALIPEVNSCAALSAAMDCSAGCLAGFGKDKPGSVHFEGHPFPICFTLTRQDGGTVARGSCSGKHHGTHRFCPCVTKNVLKEERNRLRDAVAREARLQMKGFEKLAELSEDVQRLIDQYNGTRSRYKAATKTLSRTEGELKELQEEERLQKEAEEIQGSGTKVNYETGEVTLSTGQTLSQAEAAKRVAAAAGSRAKVADGEGALPAVRDPAILVYDFSLLSEIGVLLLAAAVGGMLAASMHLPASLGFLIGGAVVGPSGLGLIASRTEQVGTIAQFGAIFPLFHSGMLFQMTDHRHYYRVSIGGTVLGVISYTVALTSVGVSIGLVKSLREGIIVGVSTAMASPGVTIGNLMEAGSSLQRAGKVAMGILAVQDIFMMILLSLPQSLGVMAAASSIATGFGLIVAVVGVAVAAARLIGAARLKVLLSQERDQDVFLLGLVALCLCMALLTGTMGLSLEMGAFAAGLAVSRLPSVERAQASIEPLSRVFGGMFFASIGMLVSPVYVIRNAGRIMQAIAVVVCIKLFFMAVIVRMFGFTGRTATSAAVALAQITEYSLLFTGKAHAAGTMDRSSYLLWLSSTVTSLVLSPLLTRAHMKLCGGGGASSGGGGEGGADAGRNDGVGGGRSPAVSDASSTSAAATAAAASAAATGSGLTRRGRAAGLDSESLRPSTVMEPASTRFPTGGKQLSPRPPLHNGAAGGRRLKLSDADDDDSGPSNPYMV